MMNRRTTNRRHTALLLAASLGLTAVLTACGTSTPDATVTPGAQQLSSTTPAASDDATPSASTATTLAQPGGTKSAALLAAITEAGIGRLLRLEIDVDRPEAAGGLSATGMLIVNPPWLLAQEAGLLLPALTERLAQGPRPRYLCEPIRPDG